MHTSLKPLTNVLIKPAGPDCNMACSYCFYLEKEKLYSEYKMHRMSEGVLEEVIRQVMSQSGRQVSFGWQGGEPTLMGLPFFQKAVDLERRYGRGQMVGNGLQTNGLLIDKDWARFFKEYSVLVGLSLDGPEHIHDYYRRQLGGRGTWSRVFDRAKLMMDAGVAVNSLTVVSDYSVHYPGEIYDFLKRSGFKYMQFIPCVESDPLNSGKAAPFSVSGEKFGKFLCKLFNLWVSDFQRGVPSTSIRFFDSLIYAYQGLEAPQCTLLKECGVYVVIEHNGDVYSCDFFVEPAWKLGNVMSSRLTDMLNSQRQREFGENKAKLPEVCRACTWLHYCRGGCIKDRLRDPRDGHGNHFCEGYRLFFAHADPRLKSLAEEGRKRLALQQRQQIEQRRGKVGRNDPCPCGSGLKYKKCCGRN